VVINDEIFQYVIFVIIHNAANFAMLFQGILRESRRRLAADFLQQYCGDECLFLLQRAEQDPQRRVLSICQPNARIWNSMA